MDPNQNEQPLLTNLSIFDSSVHSSTITEFTNRLAISGTELNTQEMSLLNQILYPPSNTRDILGCFFKICFLTSLAGTGTGCTIQCIGGLVDFPEAMKLAFAFPAFMGWAAGLFFSVPPLLHYGCCIKKTETETETETHGTAMGNIVGYLPANHHLFQRADDHNQPVAREIREIEPEIAEDFRIRPPSGYMPPQIPQMI